MTNTHCPLVSMLFQIDFRDITDNRSIVMSCIHLLSPMLVLFFLNFDYFAWALATNDLVAKMLDIGHLIFTTSC